MLIIERNKFDPGEFVFYVTDTDTVWLVEWVGVDANEQVRYGLTSGSDTAIAYEFELIGSKGDDGNRQHLGNVVDDENETEMA